MGNLINEIFHGQLNGLSGACLSLTIDDCIKLIEKTETRIFEILDDKFPDKPLNKNVIDKCKSYGDRLAVETARIAVQKTIEHVKQIIKDEL